MYEPVNLIGRIDSRQALEYTEALSLSPLSVKAFPEARHIFTHVEWLMTGYRLVLKEEIPGYIWRTPEEIRRDYSLPTAFRFYQNQLD